MLFNRSHVDFASDRMHLGTMVVHRFEFERANRWQQGVDPTDHVCAILIEWSVIPCRDKGESKIFKNTILFPTSKALEKRSDSAIEIGKVLIGHKKQIVFIQILEIFETSLITLINCTSGIIRPNLSSGREQAFPPGYSNWIAAFLDPISRLGCRVQVHQSQY